MPKPKVQKATVLSLSQTTNFRPFQNELDNNFKFDENDIKYS